jgi:GSH-dependent disulfide-bond oxidoreductase
MIELYTWGTPNGRKISIMLEEIGMPCNVHPVNLRNNGQKTPEFLAINPNGRIPAIIDTDGPGGKPLTIFESGAILSHVAAGRGVVPN